MKKHRKAWGRLTREAPKAAEELREMKAFLAFRTLPRPGEPLDAQPARFWRLYEFLTDEGVLDGA